MLSTAQLIDKYDIACPRYTSYPTVPYWQDNLQIEDWKKSIQQAYQQNKQKGVSLYIHLPCCEQLCTYCGCNK
ncbi:MAG: coproporphyrinogen III oxidase, partial [Bacteroidota bacterium]